MTSEHKLHFVASQSEGPACRARRRQTYRKLVVAAVSSVCALPAGVAFSAETSADKSDYNLFNPTPTELLRDLSTDRPDKTESAYTVDAGHFQIEADLFNYSHDHDTRSGADTVVDAFTIGSVNVKAGLLNWMDLQLIFDTYSHVTTDDRVTAQKVTQSGAGDFTTRLKMNLWGNDGGPTALAVMPFVKAPTSQDNLGNDDVEGGVIIPLALSLPHGWDMGLMTEFDFVRNGADTGYTTDFVNTVTVSHNIVGNLGGYLEFFSQVSSESGVDWIGTVDFGLTYGISENLQLDGGINIGVTDSADDLNPFVGLSYRF